MAIRYITGLSLICASLCFSDPTEDNLSIESWTWGADLQNGWLEFNAAPKEKMNVYKLMMQKEHMLAFLSHPKTISYFAQEQRKVEEFLIPLQKDTLDCIDAHPEMFANQEEALLAKEIFSYGFDLLIHPSVYRDILVPFLVWGIFDTSALQDGKEILDIQRLQTLLFKEWLAREGISSEDPDLVQKLLEFSLDSRHPAFSKFLAPALAAGLQIDEDLALEDFLGMFEGEGVEKVSFVQDRELDKIFDPSSVALWDQRADAYVEDQGDSSSSDTLSDFSWDSEDLSNDPLDDVFARHDRPNVFLYKEWVQLFFEVMIETYPERAEEFLRIQQAAFSSSQE
ncbi:MAG: hypothetical protein FJZ58_02205 [Chlamydiae bacterium]|nr:hypothetical protein [Chlamydiota bacterium]